VAGSSEGGTDGVSNAHGIIMSVVFLVGYSIGAFLMPVFGKWLLHAGWQILAFVGMWIGFGLGKVAADRGKQVRVLAPFFRCPTDFVSELLSDSSF
jgi:MFS family permease